MDPNPALTFTVRHWYEEWMEEARCSWVDPDLFFPPKGGPVRDAKAICFTDCPVRLTCLEYAMRFETGASTWTRTGIYGGMTGNERRLYEPEWLAGQEGAA